LRRQQIRFALSKVSKSRVVNPVDATDERPLIPTSNVLIGTFAAAPLAETSEASTTLASLSTPALAGGPVDIRPRALRKPIAEKRSAGRQPRATRARKYRLEATRSKARSAKSRRCKRKPEKQGLGYRIAAAISKQIARPLNAAGRSIAPVRRTLTQTVGKAGDALDSLRRKIL